MMVACTAAALDGNLVVEEPYFFCEPGNNVDLNSKLAPPPPPPETVVGQKRTVPNNTGAGTTKAMLKKARKISFQSSCGGVNTCNTNLKSPQLAMIAPKLSLIHI